MTDQPTDAAVEQRFLLVKRGLYYRPANAGYTGVKEQAGRYYASEACDMEGVSAIHEDEAPMFAEACWQDVKVKYLLGLIEAERQRAERAEKLLAAWVSWSCGQVGASPFADTKDFLHSPEQPAGGA